ncbi:hypothetical protein ABEW00_17565 [Rossellomorea vietnamensis]|uniref:hypothetical protein n=1 Tax=Rossellomorea vietnamensis TaxID=218284 RepID=UPI003D2E7C8C
MGILTSILAWLGGGSIVLFGLFKWIGKITNDRFKIKWQHENQKDIEGFKALVSSNTEFLKASLASLANEYSSAQERRLIAVENLWNCIIIIRKYNSPIINFYSILLPKEYKTVLCENKEFLGIERISEDSLYDLNLEIDNIEKHRPFIGENLWNLFYLYRAFMLRMCYLFIKGRKKEDIKSWSEDKHLIEIANYLLGEKLKTVEVSSLSSLQTIIGLFEQKIITEMEKLISGKTASEISFNEAKKILELINEVDKDKY